MKALQIARTVFPEKHYEDGFLGYVIWNQTGFPSFWNKEDGNTPEECLLNQLKNFRFCLLWNLELPEDKEFRKLEELSLTH